MEKEIQEELQELQNLETAGTLDDAQQSRLSVLNMLDGAEKTAAQKSKDLESALAQKEHFRTKFEEAEAKGKEKKPEAPPKSDGLDYGEKSFLISNGIKGQKEFDFVQAELKKSGSRDLDALLENGYFKSGLENFRALNATADATPTGKRGSGVATDSVEYWMARPIEEVPKDMRIKVVNAKLEKEKNKGQFYNS